MKTICTIFGQINSLQIGFGNWYYSKLLRSYQTSKTFNIQK